MINLSIIGNIGQDAEVKTFDGQQVCVFNVCCDAGKDKSVWVSVSSRSLATSNVVRYLVKGQLIYAQGLMTTRVYMGRDGQYHAGINLFANDVRLCGAAPKTEQQQSQAAQQEYDTPF